MATTFRDSLAGIDLDPVDKFDYDTQGTIGIAVEFFVTYSCNEAPKVDQVKIRGFNQIGFIVSSEYDVDAYVDDSNVIRVEKGGCQKAIKYEITVRFYIYLVIGIGFGLGGGTGTLGWKSKSNEQVKTFTTHSICCDPVTP